MGNCSNISNTQSVSLTAGTITSGFCHTSLQTTYEEFIARTTASLSGNLAGFVAGDDTPSASDQDKLWYRQSASNCNDHLGWHFYNTTSSAWEAVKTPVSSLADNTQGDIIYYGASGAPAVLNAGTDGHFLKTKGAGQNPEWAEVDQTQPLIGIRVGASSTSKVGLSNNNQGTTGNLTNSNSVSLTGGKTYLLEYDACISCPDDSYAEPNSEYWQSTYSTDNSSYTDMIPFYSYKRKGGGSGHHYDFTLNGTFSHKLTVTNTGSYYFGMTGKANGRISDFILKIWDGDFMESNGPSYTI